MRRLLSTRRRRVLAASVGALVVTGSAVAAFILYTGVDGSAQGTFQAGSTASAITVTGTTQPTLSNTGLPEQMSVSGTNNDPAGAHTLDSLSGTFTSSPPECASHLAVGSPSQSIMGSYAAGQTKTGTVLVSADITTPATCAAGTWQLAFTGTTTP